MATRHGRIGTKRPHRHAATLAVLSLGTALLLLTSHPLLAQTAPAEMSPDQLAKLLNSQQGKIGTQTAVSGSDQDTATSTDTASDDPQATQTPDSTATASIPTGTSEDDPLLDPAYDPNQRDNLREQTVDGLTKSGVGDGTAPGLRLGTMVLKPSISQGVTVETTRTGSTKDTRTFLQTGFKGTLTSDWSQHELTVNGEGVWQKVISGSGGEKPELNLDAKLRLDVTRDTTATLKAAFENRREDSTDPNSISGATAQSTVNTLSAGLDVEHDFGLIRGTVGFDASRSAFGSATLANGKTLSLADRDATTGTLRGRIGYELSPALIPFLELSAGRTQYDMRLDSDGYRRDSVLYAAKAGVEVDLGEKLKGELSGGYERSTFEDKRLDSIGAFTVDGSATWSPMRGTDIILGLNTTIEPSTTKGVSGSVAYGTSTTVQHQINDNLLARLASTVTWRDYPVNTSQGQQTVLTLAPGVTWGINRYLDLTSDLSYELTKSTKSNDSSVMRATIGLQLKR